MRVCEAAENHGRLGDAVLVPIRQGNDFGSAAARHQQHAFRTHRHQAGARQVGGEHADAKPGGSLRSSSGATAGAGVQPAPAPAWRSTPVPQDSQGNCPMRLSLAPILLFTSGIVP